MVLQTSPQRRWVEAALAWYFVAVWGTGFIAAKTGLQHAPPFTFLALRFAFGIARLVPIALVVKPRWPRSLAGAIVFLVIGTSILGVNALHMLMRRGQAARVASLIRSK